MTHHQTQRWAALVEVVRGRFICRGLGASRLPLRSLRLV